LVIENKVLYTKSFDIKAPSGYNVNYSNEIFPTVKLYPENRKPDITILCYGEILIEVEKAVEASFLEEEIFCEVICPTQISPVNINYLLPSLRNTNHLLTVEEGSNIAAFSSEVSALIMEKKISLKSFSRIGNNGIIPSSYEAEMKILPNSYSIFQTIKKIYYE
jgi:pyruvate/2-oxoglutarate/acetoin dehydrogenase E1 component